MDVPDRSSTSPWNKIQDAKCFQTGPSLRLFWYATWILCMSFVTTGLPQQGSQAATIASGRTASQAELLHWSVEARLPALALSAGLCPDTLGRDPLTGSLPPSSLYLRIPGFEACSLAGLSIQSPPASVGLPCVAFSHQDQFDTSG